MASQDEVLRLAAEVVDKWSGPLADMRRSFTRMEDQLKNAHKHGREEATKHRTAVLDLHKAFERIDGTLKTSFVPAIAAMGVTVLSVGGAFEALRSTLLGFGESTRALTFLSRETGVTIDQLRAFDALARRLGTSPDAMHQGVKQFAQHMHDLRNLVPSEIQAWRQSLNPGLNNFVQSLSRLPLGEALSKAIGELGAIPDQQEKRRYLRMLGLPENLADVPVDRLRQMMADIRKNIGELGPDAQKKALEFQNAIERLTDSIERLKLDVGSGLADSFTRAIEGMRTFISENRGQLIPVLKDVGTALKEIATDLKTIFDLYKQTRSGDYGGIKDFLLGPKGEPGLRSWWNSASHFLSSPFPWSIEALPNAKPGGPQPSGGGDLGLNQFNMPGGSLDWQKRQLFHKESFSPGVHSGGGYLMNAAFTTGGSNDPTAIIAKGTKTGVIEAFREWQAYSEGNGELGAGGITRASFTPSGAPLSGAGNGLAPEIGDGGGRRGSRRFAALPPAGGNAGADAIGKTIREGQLAGGANGPLDRSRFAKELRDNPALKEKIFQLAAGEDRPSHGQSATAFQAVLESMMNRAEMRGTSLAAQAKWYGREPGGYYAGKPSHLSSHEREVAEHALRDVLGGSNVSNYATDNSSGGLAARERATGKFRFRSQYHGESFFAPGWAEPRFARSYDRWRAGIGDGLLHHYTTDEIQRTLGMQLNHKVEGSASVHVKLDGLPKGARASASSSGVFGPVTLHRGRTMVPATSTQE